MLNIATVITTPGLCPHQPAVVVVVPPDGAEDVLPCLADAAGQLVQGLLQPSVQDREGLLHGDQPPTQLITLHTIVWTRKIPKLWSEKSPSPTNHHLLKDLCFSIILYIKHFYLTLYI